MRQRVERFTRALDAPAFTLAGPVEIDEVYISAGLKGRERDVPSRSRGLSIRSCGAYDQDKPPIFTLVDRGAEQRYIVPAKSAEESSVRLLLADREEEPLTVFIDGFRAYDPLEEHDGEYADGAVHVNSCESHGCCCDRGSRRIEASPKTS